MIIEMEMSFDGLKLQIEGQTYYVINKNLTEDEKERILIRLLNRSEMSLLICEGKELKC